MAFPVLRLRLRCTELNLSELLHHDYTELDVTELHFTAPQFINHYLSLHWTDLHNTSMKCTAMGCTQGSVSHHCHQTTCLCRARLGYESRNLLACLPFEPGKTVCVYWAIVALHLPIWPTVSLHNNCFSLNS